MISRDFLVRKMLGQRVVPCTETVGRGRVGDAGERLGV
jgi:hypothetical protein